jgi:hypothetical protein
VPAIRRSSSPMTRSPVVPYCPRRIRRHAAGACPVIRLNARLNAASDSYPTSAAIAATFAEPVAS